MVPVGHWLVTEAAELCWLFTKGYVVHIQLSPKLQHTIPEDGIIGKADPTAAVTLMHFLAEAMAAQEAIRNLFISFCLSSNSSSSIFQLSALAKAAMKALPQQFTARYDNDINPSGKPK